MALLLFIGASVGKSFWFIQMNDTIGLTLESMDPLKPGWPEAHDLSEMAGKFTFIGHVYTFKSSKWQSNLTEVAFKAQHSSKALLKIAIRRRYREVDTDQTLFSSYST